MKKIVIIIVTLLLVGCSKPTTLNLNKIETDLSKLTYSDKLIFENNQNVDKQLLKDKYDVNLDDTEDFIISMPSLVENANMYIIAKPKKGKQNEVKKELDKLMQKYAEKWTMGYYPKEEDKVKNKMEKTVDGYLIYIISDDNELVLDTIKRGK